MTEIAADMHAGLLAVAVAVGAGLEVAVPSVPRTEAGWSAPDEHPA